MATDKLTLELTVQQVNDAVKPIYSPLYSIFTKKTKYKETIGQVAFQRNDTLGDLEAKNLAAQNTERKHIVVGSGKKYFNKYFKGISYVESGYQEPGNINKISTRVIDTHSKQLDRMIFTGDPDAAGTLQNNGIFKSDDKNLIKNGDFNLPDKTINTIATFFNTILKQSEDATGNSKKTILLGGKLRDLITNFINNTAVSYRKALDDIFPVQTDIVPLPANLNNLASVGDIAIVLSLEDLMLNYLALPQLEDQGYDARNKESWFNFYFGSAMVDIETEGGIIIQPVTGL
ncbi:MAG: hypothetical protein LBU09_00955 [Endomicrobium sp.]|jgi:hypothetical protein|nr:hypothetical protein [Endomicrobium sp.]